MRKLAIACLLVLFVSCAAMAQTDLPEYASVVRVTVTHADFKGWTYGTGFFVNPDTVLTASHVVAHAVGDKSAHILALWSDSSGDRRYFKLDLVCETNLPTAAQGQFVRFGRDVAVLKISPVPKGQGWSVRWGFALPGGQRYDWTAWTDDLPTFAPMALADGTPSSGNVRLPSYAHISAIPRLFEATGTIDSTRRETDGTTILNMRFTNPDTSGGSGGPILDAQNRVVGMNAWGDTDPSTGHGEGVEVLHKPCGSATF